MPVPKRVTIAAISAALLACGAILCIPLVPHWHAYRFRRQDAAIRLGMDKGDVHAILGEPTSARGFVDEAEILALRRRGWNGDAKQLTRSIWIRVSRDGQVHGLALVFDGDTVLDKSRSD